MGDWLPKSVLCLRSYTKRMFVADLIAGITVGLVALPLAMAFAIASGMPPQAGLCGRTKVCEQMCSDGVTCALIS